MPMNKQEKLPSGDFFVTIARKIRVLEGENNESLSACKYRDL